MRFWGIGNESWGCGGNFTPEEYATEYRRFVAWVPRYGVNLMANVAQLVNCLQSLFLADEDRFVATPVFHVFETYGAHVGGRAVRTVFSAPRIGYERVNAKGSTLSESAPAADSGSRRHA